MQGWQKCALCSLASLLVPFQSITRRNHDMFVKNLVSVAGSEKWSRWRRDVAIVMAMSAAVLTVARRIHQWSRLWGWMGSVVLIGRDVYPRFLLVDSAARNLSKQRVSLFWIGWLLLLSELGWISDSSIMWWLTVVSNGREAIEPLAFINKSKVTMPFRSLCQTGDRGETIVSESENIEHLLEIERLRGATLPLPKFSIFILKWYGKYFGVARATCVPLSNWSTLYFSYRATWSSLHRSSLVSCLK